MPHIQLFTGARLNEVCQLQTADIVFPEILWLQTHLLLLPAGTGQKLKNKRSVRLIPIHQLWNDLGFKEYYKAIKNHGFDYLFPNLRLDGKEKRSDYVGDWFGRLLDILKIKRPEISKQFIPAYVHQLLPSRTNCPNVLRRILQVMPIAVPTRKNWKTTAGNCVWLPMYGDNYYPCAAAIH